LIVIRLHDNEKASFDIISKETAMLLGGLKIQAGLSRKGGAKVLKA